MYCAYLDLAARRIDQLMSETEHVQPSAFFGEDQFGARIIKVFIHEHMNPDQASAWLSAATPEINKLVDAELLKRR